MWLSVRIHHTFSLAIVYYHSQHSACMCYRNFEVVANYYVPSIRLLESVTVEMAR